MFLSYSSDHILLCPTEWELSVGETFKWIFCTQRSETSQFSEGQESLSEQEFLSLRQGITCHWNIGSSDVFTFISHPLRPIKPPASTIWSDHAVLLSVAQHRIVIWLALTWCSELEPWSSLFFCTLRTKTPANKQCRYQSKRSITAQINKHFGWVVQPFQHHSTSSRLCKYHSDTQNSTDPAFAWKDGTQHSTKNEIIK